MSEKRQTEKGTKLDIERKHRDREMKRAPERDRTDNGQIECNKGVGERQREKGRQTERTTTKLWKYTIQFEFIRR